MPPAARQLLGDERVVAGRQPERRRGQLAAHVVGQPAAVAQLEQHGVVLRRVGDDADAGVVLGGRAHERRPADVDLLDQLVVGRAFARGRLGERVEVDDHELERLDLRGGELLAMVGQPLIGQHARGDARMERLDPAVEHLGEAGHVGNVGHLETCLAHGAGRAAGRDELEAEAGQARREGRQAALVGHRDERSARRGTSAASCRSIATRPSTTLMRPPERCDDARQQLVLDGVNAAQQRRLVVVGQHRDRLLGNDRAAVERLVDDVHRHPGHARAAGQRVGNRARARERRQQARMDVQDAAGERGQRSSARGRA